MTLTLQDLQGRPKQRRAERRMSIVFMAAAMLAIVVSALILYALIDGTIDFLRAIDFDWGKLSDPLGWNARRQKFDLRTIMVGSVIAGSVALLVAIPFGLGTAIYLSEYAKPRTRRYVKPIIEVLAGLPSVTVGLFAILFIAPDVVGTLFNPHNEKNLLVAGLGIGLLVIPIMASVSEDALKAVPSALREASYGIGAKKVTTVFRVVLPAAVSGIVAAFIIAASRAIGETMVATLASGGADSVKWNGFSPLKPGMTMTGAMTNALGGSDAARTKAGYQVLFFVGALLFVITLLLNMVGDRFVQRIRHKY